MKELYKGAILKDTILFDSSKLENSCFKFGDNVIINYDEENERIIIENIEEKYKQWVKKYGDTLYDDYYYDVEYVENMVIVAFADDSNDIRIKYAKLDNQSREEKERGLAICMANYLCEEIPSYIKQLE